MAQAFQSFEKCAKLGDAESARYLGIMYMRGKGVNKSAHEAIKWFEVAAKQGDNLAEKELVNASQNNEAVKFLRFTQLVNFARIIVLGEMAEWSNALVC